MSMGTLFGLAFWVFVGLAIWRRPEWANWNPILRPANLIGYLVLAMAFHLVAGDQPWWVWVLVGVTIIEVVHRVTRRLLSPRRITKREHQRRTKVL